MTASLLAFIPVALLLTLIPGADTALVTRNALTLGLRGARWTIVGICTGCLIHATASALGLSAILATSAAAFTVVKLAGAAYILYLAIGMLLSKRSGNDAPAPLKVAPLPWRRIYAQGILTNVLNPKVALFFLAFVPQFIAANAPHKALAFLLLGTIFNINGMLWCHALALFTSQTSARIKLNPAVAQWLNRATGGLFVWLGVKLALAQQH